MSMLNGHDPLQAALDQAKQQQAQDQMLRQVLQQALQNPAKITQATGPSLVHVAHQADGGNVLLVALVTGERWDIPLDALTSRRIAYVLASNHNAGEDTEVAA
jgi:hypothetical protein